MSKQLPSPSSLRQLKIQAKDLRRAYQSGDREALQRFREYHPRCTESSDADLVAAQLTLQDAQLVVAREYDCDSWPKLTASVGSAVQPARAADGIVGSSEVIRQIRASVERAAKGDVPILVTGERGVGKRLLARTVHAMSERSRGPRVQFACDVASGPLEESELFGHEPGAFTGANATRVGKVDEATDGTLVLDEVSCLSMAAQMQLLDLMETGVYRRVGGSEDRPAKPRLVATTSQDLGPMLASGAFREDLYYRLQVMRIDAPSLRDRIEDIPELATHFAARAAQSAGREAPRFSDEALSLLAGHDWPGNVRELQHAIEGAVMSSSDEVITPQHIRLSPGEAASHGAAA